ncbi:MAG: protein kinase [Nocardioidaceae bacterium]
MATVYEANDLRLDRPVAIKVMPHALADNEEFSQRFVREARAAARLTHPNVVAIYDQGDDDGTLFLAMEYVAGRVTLRDVIRAEAPLSPGRALMFFEEILKAIAAAHESGIIHRDVKPENVLIDPRGRVKVADFGLARAISSATTATATAGVLMGTVSYIAPELVTEGRSDARSDVYALGVLLFELLTGHKPHVGDSPIQVAYKHVHDDVPAPSTMVDGIPAYLDAFVARATARQRDLRPADAHVMLQQLRRVRHALDHGVVDDEELTSDLTPTVAVGTAPGAGWAYDDVFDLLTDDKSVRSHDGSRSPPADDDEVFDVTDYDDFTRMDSRFVAAAGMAATGPDFVRATDDRTSVLPTSRADHYDTLESPRQDERAGDYTAPGRPMVLPRRKKRGGWIAFFLVLLLAAGAATAGWYYGIARYRDTPNVVSVSQGKAAAALAEAGLDLRIKDSAYSERVLQGHVISTDPGPGSRVLEGGTVTAVVSRGPERHDVPALRTLTEAEAIDALHDRSLTAAAPKRIWSDKLAAGQVISFSPTEGTPLRPDAVVKLVISRGPKPISITDQTGEQADTAEAALKEAGFEVASQEVYNDDVAEGVVIRQRPDDGTGHRGDKIRLVVSRGPHLVEIPDVIQRGSRRRQADPRRRGLRGQRHGSISRTSVSATSSPRTPMPARWHPTVPPSRSSSSDAPRRPPAHAAASVPL